MKTFENFDRKFYCEELYISFRFLNDQGYQSEFEHLLFYSTGTNVEWLFYYNKTSKNFIQNERAYKKLNNGIPFEEFIKYFKLDREKVYY